MDEKKDITLQRQVSFAERYLWQHLRRKRLEGENFQFCFPTPQGNAQFVDDKHKLVIEIVTDFQNAHGKEKKRPAARFQAEKNEFQTLRFSQDEIVKDIDSVLRSIEQRAARSQN